MGTLTLTLFAVAIVAMFLLIEKRVKRQERYDAIFCTLRNMRQGDIIRIKHKKDKFIFHAFFIGNQGDNMTVIIAAEELEIVISIYDIEYIYKLNK